MGDYIKEFTDIMRIQWPFFVVGASVIAIVSLSLSLFKSTLLYQPGFILGACVAIATISFTAWHMLDNGYKFVGFKVWEKE